MQQEKVSENFEQQSKLEANGKHKSRRQLLRKGFVAATAALGAGALLETGIASAHTDTPADNVGNFSSSDGSTPAVTATGTNGSDGVLAQSTGGDGLHAIGGGAGHSGVFAEGGVSDGVYSTSNGPGKSGVFGFNSSSTGYGIYGEGDTGTGVRGATSSGIGVQATANGSTLNTAGVKNTAVLADGGSTYALYATNNNTTSPTIFASNTAAGAGVALDVQGLVQVQGNSVGQATLAAGTTSVTLTTSAATTSSIIVLTPLSKPKTLWVTRANGSFTIHASASSTSNIVIAYLIIN